MAGKPAEAERTRGAAWPQESATSPTTANGDALLLTRGIRPNLSLPWMPSEKGDPVLGMLDVRAERRPWHESCEDFAIRTPSASSPWSQLSGGNQQKVVLARWFALTEGGDIWRSPRAASTSEPRARSTASCRTWPSRVPGSS